MGVKSTGEPMKKVILIACIAVLITAHSCSNVQVTLQNPGLQYTNPVLQSHTWLTLETTHFTIFYRDGHEIFAQEVADIAESIYDDATSFMRCTPPKKVEIVIYPSDTRFFTWESSFSDRAYAHSDFKSIILIYGCPFSTEVCGWNYHDVKRALRHELNHVLFYWLIDNTVYTDELRDNHQWILEGIATYYEQYPYEPDDDYFMLPMVIHYLEETNEFPTCLEDISFEKYERLSYPLAASVIQFMIDVYGEEKFHTFLDTLKEWDVTQSSTHTVESALHEAFGTPKEVFEKEWASHVKEKYAAHEPHSFEAVQITNPPGWKVPSSWYGNKILFVSDTEQNLDVFIMNADGSGTKQLTIDKACDFDPKFSPDGSKIAFTSVRDGYAHIYCMDVDGSNVTKITSGSCMDFMGSWSPDGATIAFTSSRSGSYDIYVMNADGSSIIQLTTHEGDDGWPVFSPDGQKIVFVSDRNGSYDLYTMHTDGTGVHQLTDTPAHENFPQYSPDGQKIAFISRWETGVELCIINNDGTEKESLVTPPSLIVDTMARHRDRIIGYPVWSPDGKKIAFIAVNQIFILSVKERHWWVIIPVVFTVCALIIFLEKRQHYEIERKEIKGITRPKTQSKNNVKVPPQLKDA